MKGAGKTRLTFQKIRLMLFVRSYAYCVFRHYIWKKYKIDQKLTSKELRKKYSNKHVAPEISRLARALNLNYALLWKAIFLNKRIGISKSISRGEKVQTYLSIEHELSTLITSKWTRSEDFFDPDYENESAILSIAIERAVGSKLANIEKDSIFSQQLEILQKSYRHWYYKIAYKYKLPTLRIVPFLLRLVTS